jgi:hypothetical protein
MMDDDSREGWARRAFCFVLFWTRATDGDDGDVDVDVEQSKAKTTDVMMMFPRVLRLVVK